MFQMLSDGPLSQWENWCFCRGITVPMRILYQEYTHWNKQNYHCKLVKYNGMREHGFTQLRAKRITFLSLLPLLVHPSFAASYSVTF